MNADAVSDLVLALTCAGLLLRRLSGRPGCALAIGLIGFAAACGVGRFSGIDWMNGPHRFASLLAGCAGFPLFAWALHWPQDAAATRPRAAAVFALVLGAVGVAATLAGVDLWAQVAPAAAALAILWRMARPPDRFGLPGAVLLLASFVSTLVGAPDARLFGWTSHVQTLHYLMALALPALVAAAPGSVHTRTR